MKLRFATQCCCVTVFVVAVFSDITTAAERGELSIERILRNARFNSRFPLEDELTRKYGKGDVQKPYKEETWHTYYVTSQHLWVRCKVEANRTKLQPVTEILVSALPLGDSRVPAALPIGRLQLKNVKIGDKADEVLRQWGSPFRSEPAKLADVQTTIYIYRADSGAAATLVSFYVQSKEVVGFSLSSPE